MDALSAFGSVNWLAVILAAVSSFVIGGLWYGPLLGKPWLALTGITEEEIQESNMVRIFGMAFVLQLVAAAVLALLIGEDAGLAYGAILGFVVGAFLVGTALGVVSLFERRPLALWGIDAGYQVVTFTVMGLVIGAW